MPNGYLAGRRNRRRLLTLTLSVAATTGGTAIMLWAWPDTGMFFTAAAGPGHGRGLSQNGAFDKAVEGWTADRILADYYPGADLADIGATTVSVRLMERDDKVLDVSSATDFYVAGRRVIPGQAAHLTPTATGADVTITQGCDGNTLWEGNTDDPWAYPVDNGVNRPAEEALEICGGNDYRGVLGVALDGGAFRTVNDVDVDDYLQGVVPAEVVPGWADQGGAEALRAQAIAARSYALAETRYPYAKTCDTTDCQMYPGTDKEDPRTTTAVNDTVGQVLVRDNHILRSEYSAAPDGGTPTPASTLEIGPALSDFPSAQTSLLPDIPGLTTPATPAEPDSTVPVDPAPASPPDATTPDSTAPGPNAADQTGSTPTLPNSVRPAPDNRNRVNIPIPLPIPGSVDPNSMLSDSRWNPQSAIPAAPLNPPSPGQTPIPNTASTPTPPTAPTHPLPGNNTSARLH